MASCSATVAPWRSTALPGKGPPFACGCRWAAAIFDGNGGAAPAGVQRALRVLVADDEPLLPDVLASLLAEDGDTVQTVGDGREALARFHKDHSDLVVTDRSLPELNGDCLAAAFKHAAPG